MCPAPTYSQFLEKLREKMIAQGLTKKEYEEDADGNVILDELGKPTIIDTEELTDDMELMLLAVSQAMSEVWTEWQAAQTVNVTVSNVTLVQPGVGTSGPGTGTGTLP